MTSSDYILVTAAYNEEQFIGETIKGIISQSILPKEWIIVSDGSTDDTDKIVTRIAREYPFINFIRIQRSPGRSFRSKVRAIRAGLLAIRSKDYDFIGNVDADVSVAPTYFQNLLEAFDLNPQLGLAGGIIKEKGGGIRIKPAGEDSRAVAHAAQLVSRKCFDEIGGYPDLPYGGPDTFLEIAVRMKGWLVQSIDSLSVLHHRPTSSANGRLKGRFKQGCQDRSFGYHPLFEVVKCAVRIGERPMFMGAASRLIGYMWAYITDAKPAVTDDFVKFVRAEQIARLSSFS